MSFLAHSKLSSFDTGSTAQTHTHTFTSSSRPLQPHPARGTTAYLFAWSSVNASEKDLFRFLIVNEEHEWMIAMEFGWFQWS